MPEYIFYTSEGFTISPNDSELDSLQILGFENGKNVEDAKAKLFIENPWINESGFNDEEIKHKMIVDKEFIKNVNQIIEYLYADEQKHFQESEEPENHIFKTLKALKESL